MSIYTCKRLPRGATILHEDFAHPADGAIGTVIRLAIGTVAWIDAAGAMRDIDWRKLPRGKRPRTDNPRRQAWSPRLTDSEIEEIGQAAERAGTTPSDYMREAALRRARRQR
jgi:hypothetical protein